MLNPVYIIKVEKWELIPDYISQLLYYSVVSICDHLGFVYKARADGQKLTNYVE